MTDISQQLVQSEQAHETILGTRTAIYVSLAVFLGFAFLDPWANQSSFSALLALRGLWCGALLMTGILTHLPWAVRYPYALSNVACLIVGSGCIVLASIAGGDNHPYHDALLLTIFGWSVLVPLRIRDALLTLSLLVVFSNVVIVAAHGMPDIASTLIRNAIYITACIISCVSASSTRACAKHAPSRSWPWHTRTPHCVNSMRPNRSFLPRQPRTANASHADHRPSRSDAALAPKPLRYFYPNSKYAIAAHCVFCAWWTIFLR